MTPGTQLRARDQRAIGPRATRTRTRILDTTALYLTTIPWHLASLPAVARRVGVSAATVYQYFPDLATVVRELAAPEGASEHVRRINELLAWENANVRRAINWDAALAAGAEEIEREDQT